MNKIIIYILAFLLLLTTGYIVKDKVWGVNSYIKTDNTNTNINDNNVSDTLINNNTDIPASTSVNSRNILNLSNQGLTKAPAYIFNMKNLEELNLSNNSLGNALQSEVRNLQNLKVLNLSNNKFTGVPAEVGHLKNLEILNLSNNELTGLPNELGNLSKLKVLNLSGNNYSEMDLEGIRKNLPASTAIIIK